MNRSTSTIESDLAREQAYLHDIIEEIARAPKRERLRLLRTKRHLTVNVLNLTRELNEAYAQATLNLEIALEIIRAREAA